MTKTALRRNRGAVFVIRGHRDSTDFEIPASILSSRSRFGGGLFADDGGFGGGDFETHEAMIRVEIENHLEIASDYF